MLYVLTCFTWLRAYVVACLRAYVLYVLLCLFAYVLTLRALIINLFQITPLFSRFLVEKMMQFLLELTECTDTLTPLPLRAF